MTAEPDLLPELVAEGLDFFNLAGDEGDKLYVRAIRQHIAAKDAEIEALRAEVERVTCELMDAITRADKLAEALRLALNSHGKTLLTDPPQDAWKVNRVEEIGRAMLREQEEGNGQ